jgi:hypothetical protein
MNEWISERILKGLFQFEGTEKIGEVETVVGAFLGG